MKEFLVVYSDPSGVLQSQELHIHVSSFPAAVVKALDYQEGFVNLVLTSIILIS